MIVTTLCVANMYYIATAKLSRCMIHYWLCVILLYQFGGVNFEDVEKTSVECRVLDGISCFGSTTFVKRNVPCLKYVEYFSIKTPLYIVFHRYKGYYFVSAMLYAVFLGFLGVDRFCMGYTCLGLAKLFTLGCLGVWWVVDVILLMTGNFTPNDDFSWEQYY